MKNDVYIRSFARAAELLGGVDKLAAHLNVSQSHVRWWIKGLDKPPMDLFLRVVDLVMDQKFGRQDESRAIPEPSADPLADG
jgi:hypothetical protein